MGTSRGCWIKIGTKNIKLFNSHVLHLFQDFSVSVAELDCVFVLELPLDQKDDNLRQEAGGRGGNCRVEPMSYIGNYLQFLKLLF